MSTNPFSPESSPASNGAVHSNEYDDQSTVERDHISTHMKQTPTDSNVTYDDSILTFDQQQHRSDLGNDNASSKTDEQFPQETHSQDTDNTVETFNPAVGEENELNRQFTLERITSRKSIDEIAREEISHEYTPNPEKTIETEEKVWEVKELDFDGPDDMANPHNWPAWKKWLITYTVAFLCLCCSLGSSMYVGSVPELMVSFGSSQELAISGVTFYVLGLGFGPAVTAPLSEIFGRRWIYVISLPIAMLFTMGVGLAQNMHTLLVLRFFCGFFASPALAIAGGTISDIWSKEPLEQSFAVAIFCLCPFLGPVLGPIIGGFAGEFKGWEWSASWVLLMFFGAVWPFVILSPETYKPIILKNRAIKRGLKVNSPKINSAFIKRIIFFDLLRPVELLFRDPIVFFMSLYISFIFAVLFAFFEAFPVIFRGIYHMDLGVSGLPFLSIMVGEILAVVLYVILDKTIYFPKNPDGSRGKRDENGNFIWDAPETKLLAGKIGSVFLPISLFWLGWSSKESVSYWAPLVAGAPFGFGLILIFLSVVLYFSMSFPPINVALAIAANNLLRYILASVFPLFTVQCFENLGVGWASSLFAFIALAMVPVPFVFGYFGPKLRARSKYGYAAFFKKMAEEKAAAEAAAAAAANTKTVDSTVEEAVVEKV